MKHFELGNNDKDEILRDFAPRAFSSPLIDQREIPALAKDLSLMAGIQKVLPSLPTFHHFHLGDAVSYPFPPDESLHLVLTSPPYWILKRYPEAQGQLGHEPDYTLFLTKLNTVSPNFRTQRDHGFGGWSSTASCVRATSRSSP